MPGSRRRRQGKEAAVTELKKKAVIEPTKQHQASVIFLHGLDDEWSYWVPIIEALKLGMDTSGIRWICLEAPRRRVWGEKMSAWFEYHTERSGEDQEDDVNEVHVDEVRSALHRMISDEASQLREISGKAEAPVFLVGSSQGGSVACDAALTADVAGVVMLRSLLLGYTLRSVSERSASARKIPLLAVSGELDDTFLLPLVTRHLAAATCADTEHVVIEGLDHMTHYDCHETFAVLKFLARHLGLDVSGGPDDLAKVLPAESPCDKSWDQLTEEEQRLATQLLGGSGSAAAWDNGTAKVWGLSWSSLSELQRRAAKSLGFNEVQWEDRDAASARDPPCDRYWADLSEEQQALAKRLGIKGANAWDNGTAPVWSKSWRKLQAQEREAAEKLGYTQSSWDADT